MRNKHQSGYSDNGPAWIGKVKFGRIIIIDSNIVGEYLALVGKNRLNDKIFQVSDIPEIYPVERIDAIENQRV